MLHHPNSALFVYFSLSIALCVCLCVFVCECVCVIKCAFIGILDYICLFDSHIISCIFCPPILLLIDHSLPLVILSTRLFTSLLYLPFSLLLFIYPFHFSSLSALFTSSLYLPFSLLLFICPFHFPSLSALFTSPLYLLFRAVNVSLMSLHSWQNTPRLPVMLPERIGRNQLEKLH